MNDVINETLELKELIEKSKEYKNYNKYIKKLENNEKLNEIINEIKKIQSKLVREENIQDEEKLNFLYDQLNQNEDYKMYLKASKELNKLITDIQDKFTKEFNDIVS